jgi:hypothetical protein
VQVEHRPERLSIPVQTAGPQPRLIPRRTIHTP